MKHEHPGINPKIDERIRVLEQLRIDRLPTEAACFLADALIDGGKILIFGNGGSSTEASHFAAELVNRFYRDRRAIPAVALTTDMAVITSVANDQAFDDVFSRQIEALGNEKDVAVGLTTSGRSPNVLKAFAIARDRGLSTMALCGRDREALKSAGVDWILGIDSEDTPLIQEMHLFILHHFAESLEKMLEAGGNG